MYLTLFYTGDFTPICLPLNGSTTSGERLIGQTGVAAGWSTMNPECECRKSLVRLYIVCWGFQLTLVVERAPLGEQLEQSRSDEVKILM